MSFTFPLKQGGCGGKLKHGKAVLRIMDGGGDFDALPTSRLLEILGEIVIILTYRLQQFGGNNPGPSTGPPPRPRQTPDPAAFECWEGCVFCGVRCCRLEPGHTHHKCRLHLRWR